MPAGRVNPMSEITIREAVGDDTPEIAAMVGELLTEIMRATGARAFNFDREETASRLRRFMGGGKYFVFVARNGDGEAIGFVALHESYALYAEGAFGTIAELYVRPGERSNKVGRSLVARAAAFGTGRGWTRLEVTTPPLPQFDRTLAFYERQGFAITGGRKLKRLL